MGRDAPNSEIQQGLPVLAHRRWKDYPSAGIDFPDSTTVTCEAAQAAQVFAELIDRMPSDVDLLAAIDIGGLGFAGALAFAKGLGFIDIRKVAALRPEVVGSVFANYDLGYGVAISKGNRIAGRSVLVIDDCLMSGTTALAAVQLLRQLGARCTHALFVFEVEGLGGAARLEAAGVTCHVLRSLPRQETP